MSSCDEISLGQIVISKSGRDKLRPFIVVEIIDDNYVRLADGKIRRISKPKLKKLKHINVTKTISDVANMKLSSGKKLLDEEIRKILENFKTGIDS